MALTRHPARWRAPLLRVIHWLNYTNYARKIDKKEKCGLQNLPPLSDRMARDIGLTQAELEWSRHRLPSQHTHHPRS